MEPFFDAYRAVKPFLITSGNPPTRERIQSQTDRARFDDTTKCILCACCTTSCPVFWNEGSYFGPAAIVNAHRFIFDSRDEAAVERLDILNDVDGVALPYHFQLHRRPPRGIQGDPGHLRGQARPDVLALTPSLQPQCGPRTETSAGRSVFGIRVEMLSVAGSAGTTLSGSGCSTVNVSSPMTCAVSRYSPSASSQASIDGSPGSTTNSVGSLRAGDDPS